MIFFKIPPMKYFKEYVFLMYLSSRFICRIATYWEIKFDFFGPQARRVFESKGGSWGPVCIFDFLGSYIQFLNNQIGSITTSQTCKLQLTFEVETVVPCSLHL